jgi:hypothetical protein
MIARRASIALASLAALTLAVAGSAALADSKSGDIAAKPAATPTTPVELAAPPAGKGQIVFFRKPRFSLIPFNWHVHEGASTICPMEAGAYCVAAVEPGTHTYEVYTEAKSVLTLEVDAGETYYVIGGISMGLIVNHPTIAPSQKAEFDAISAKLKSLPPTPSQPQSQPASQPTS